MKQQQFEFMKNMKKDYEALGEQIGILLNEKQESIRTINFSFLFCILIF